MMKPQSQCRDCFLRQADDAATRIGLNEAHSSELIAAVKELLDSLPAGTPPPITASQVHATVRKIGLNPDPYRNAKAEATDHALSLYPRLKQRINMANNPLETAIRIAIAGNIIDLGVADEYDLEASIERVLAIEPAINDIEPLREAIAGADSILYLADNAGETVLDRLLIEQLDKPVTYAVKSGPAVNDATVADALAAGLDRCCEIVPYGGATLGTLLDQATPELHQQFDTAPLIIAKGMANYESLCGSRSGLFFLLQTKCAVVADHLGVKEKSIIIKQDSPRHDQ